MNVEKFMARALIKIKKVERLEQVWKKRNETKAEVKKEEEEVEVGSSRKSSRSRGKHVIVSITKSVSQNYEGER